MFNIETGADPNSSDQVLSIRLGERHFGFAITSHPANELQRLVWYAGEDTWDHELEELYVAHPELHGDFTRTMIAYDHPQSILIPPNSYTGNDHRILLETMYGVNGNHTVLTEEVTGWQLKNIFAVPLQTKDWATRHFSTGSYHHNYSIGIKLIDNSAIEGSLLVDFRSTDFTMVVSKANRLLMAQTYSYTTPADVIYYLVKVCNEFGFSQQTVRVSLSGLIEKESNLYRELVQYFIHIKLREPAWQIPPKEEENYPSHFFTSLNDLAVCEL
ncbi:MAG: DUF3822 family protein [Chitinophagaceae bacterium]